MNTKGNNLNDVTDKLVTAILDEPFLNKSTLQPKVRAILQAWLKVHDRPLNYDEPKSDYGKLQKTIEMRDIQCVFWKNKFKDITGKENMQPHYDELTSKLIELWYQRAVEK